MLDRIRVHWVCTSITIGTYEQLYTQSTLRCIQTLYRDTESANCFSSCLDLNQVSYWFLSKVKDFGTL